MPKFCLHYNVQGTIECKTANSVFLADRTNGRAYATVLRLSVRPSVCDVMYCG